MNYSSDHFNGKIFSNPVPTEVMPKGSFGRVLKMYMKKHPNREPLNAAGPFMVDLSVVNNLPADALRITWLGHSSNLLEIDGERS
jgi:hypothetical protein